MMDPEDFPEDFADRLATGTDFRLIMTAIIFVIMGVGVLLLLLG